MRTGLFIVALVLLVGCTTGRGQGRVTNQRQIDEPRQGMTMQGQMYHRDTQGNMTIWRQDGTYDYVYGPQ